MRRFDDVRRRIIRCVVGSALLVSWISPSAAIAEGPRPPCGSPPLPFYAEAGALATVRTWQGKTLPEPWIPPPCLQWQVRGFATLVAVAGRINGISDGAQLLRRLVSTEQVREIRYWSFSRKIWRNLFAEVDMLAGPDPKLKRPDFGSDEIRTGQNYFMWQKENSIVSGMVFRGHFQQISERSIVFQQVNLTASYLLLIKLLAPREFETAYYLRHESGEVWRYYSLTRFGTVDRPLSDAQLASVINRSIAIYRYLAGVPMDREPPAAP